MKNLILITILTIFQNISYSQSEIDPKTEIIYYLKVFNREYKSERFILNWLKYFDPKFKEYSLNEFKLREKKQNAINEIENLITKLDFNNIYIGYSDMGYNAPTVKFGEYNFNKKEFAFFPFTDETDDRDKESNVINENNYFFNYAGIDAADFHSTNIHVINHKDFNGLPLAEEKAQQLIEKRTIKSGTNFKIDKRLYIKYYYSILNKKNQYIGGYNTIQERDLYLSCYVYKVEIWEDLCMFKNLITTIEAKSIPPLYLDSTKNRFELDYSLGLIPFRDTFWVSDNSVYLTNSNFNYIENEKCYKSHFQVVLDLDSYTKDLFIIRFFFNTNACLNFSEYFTYIFYDKTGLEYPLKTATVGAGALNSNSDKIYYSPNFLINKETLTLLTNNGLAKIFCQFRSTKYNFNKFDNVGVPCVKLGNLSRIVDSEGLIIKINEQNNKKFIERANVILKK